MSELPDGEGNCYEVAANIVIDGGLSVEDPLVVHGYPTLQREPFCKYGHAWIELGGIILDVANGRRAVIPRDVYYALGNIDPEECFHYGRREVVDKINEFNHYGPWDGPHGCPPASDEDMEER